MMTAIVKKPTSRRNGTGLTLNGRMMHMEPTMQDTMEATPRSLPMAKLPESARMAEKVPNISGLAFPNARNVTPATFHQAQEIGK